MVCSLLCSCILLLHHSPGPGPVLLSCALYDIPKYKVSGSGVLCYLSVPGYRMYITEYDLSGFGVLCYLSVPSYRVFVRFPGVLSVPGYRGYAMFDMWWRCSEIMKLSGVWHIMAPLTGGRLYSLSLMQNLPFKTKHFDILHIVYTFCIFRFDYDSVLSAIFSA